jgi:hypothetical protein
MVNPNQDPYELSTPKHWRIIHRIYGPKYELLNEFLYYIRLHISWSARSCKIHSESVTKYCTRCYKGPHWALRCGVLDGSSELGIPADLPVPRWVTTGSHELTTAPAVPRAYLQFTRSTSKDWTTKTQQDWLINVGINNWLLACNTSWDKLYSMSNSR